MRGRWRFVDIYTVNLKVRRVHECKETSGETGSPETDTGMLIFSFWSLLPLPKVFALQPGCAVGRVNTQTQHSVSMWRMEHSKEWRRQAVRSWCMTVSVFAADSDSFCALSPPRSGFAHLLSFFPPVAFISSRQMCFCVKSSCTVGVWSSGAPLASTLFFITATTHLSPSLPRL